MRNNFFLIIIFLLLFSKSLFSEQWEWLLEDQALEAVKLISGHKKIRKYCKPCRGDPFEIIIKKISVERVSDGSYRFILNGISQDLAYLYYFTEGRWKNIAITLGLKTHGLDEFITKSTDNPQ